MKAVIQRVKRAEVGAGDRRAAIGPGLLVLAGLEAGEPRSRAAGPRPRSPP